MRTSAAAFPWGGAGWRGSKSARGPLTARGGPRLGRGDPRRLAPIPGGQQFLPFTLL